jgi:hypothetical protein
MAVFSDKLLLQFLQDDFVTELLTNQLGSSMAQSTSYPHCARRAIHALASFDAPATCVVRGGKPMSCATSLNSEPRELHKINFRVPCAIGWRRHSSTSIRAPSDSFDHSVIRSIKVTRPHRKRGLVSFLNQPSSNGMDRPVYSQRRQWTLTQRLNNMIRRVEMKRFLCCRSPTAPLRARWY